MEFYTPFLQKGKNYETKIIIDAGLSNICIGFLR